MHKTMVSVASLEKIEIIRSEEFMPSEARQKFLKKMIILGPKTAILGPQFCRILVPGPLLDPPLGLMLLKHFQQTIGGVLQNEEVFRIRKKHAPPPVGSAVAAFY